MTQKEKTFRFLFLIAAITCPLTVVAANLWGFVGVSQNILNVTIPFLMTLAVAVFIWGVMMYIASAGDVEKQKKARGRIVYGLIGLFVLVAFWGLVTVVTDTFGINENRAPFETGIDLAF